LITTIYQTLFAFSNRASILSLLTFFPFFIFVILPQQWHHIHNTFTPMETANSEQHAGERRTRPRLQNRRSFADSPLSPLPPKNSQKKKRKKATPSTEFYSVKGILAEKQEAGKTLYYIDWEDNQETGQPYSPTWVKSPSRCWEF